MPEIMELEANSTRDSNIEYLSPYINAFRGVSSLDVNQAKLCVYYSMLTYKLEELLLYPILTLYGPYSTGKSGIMTVMVQLVNNPIPLPDFTNFREWQGLSSRDTVPSLRNLFGNNTTAFIEEGDNGKQREKLIADRFSRQTATWRYQQEQLHGYITAMPRFFGATVIHKRSGYRDPATTSRSIILKTRPEPNKTHNITIFDEAERNRFRQFAINYNYNEVETNTRAPDLWMPLISLVATYVRDVDWFIWAQGQMDIQSQRQASGGDYDPQKATIYALLDAAITANELGILQFNEGKYELGGIQRHIEHELGIRMSIAQLENTLQLQSFVVKKRQGTPRVHITTERLREACNEFGIEDEALDILPGG